MYWTLKKKMLFSSDYNINSIKIGKGRYTCVFFLVRKTFENFMLNSY